MPPPETKRDVSPFVECSVEEVLKRLEGPLEEVRGLPNEAFTSQSFFDWECETLFARGWSFAGRSSSVPETGDMVPVAVAGHPLVIVRNSPGTVGVFHNVCPHRGARIVPEPVAKKSAIVCPYHAWTFGLDGALRSRPHFHGPGENDVANGDDDAPCLYEVRTALWSDLIFVNLDGAAPPFETYIAGIRSGWREFDIADISCTHHFSLELECNWKLAVENYCDFYHVFRVHPELDASLAANRRTGMTCDGTVLHNRNWAEESRSTVTVLEHATVLPDLSGALEDGRRKTVFGIIFPNTGINIHRSDVQFTHFEPLGPARTRLHRWIYFPANVANDDRYREVRARICEDWERVLREDEQVCQWVQQGRQSKVYDGGRFAPAWDAGTRHFHRLVARAVGEDGLTVAGIVPEHDPDATTLPRER